MSPAIHGPPLSFKMMPLQQSNSTGSSVRRPEIASASSMYSHGM